MTDAAGFEFKLRPIAAEDSFTSIKGGGQQYQLLTAFARKKAKKYEAANLSRTYVVHDVTNNRMAAYVTLVCSEVASKEETGAIIPDADYSYPHYPAVKIARLLVDERYRSRSENSLGKFGLGPTLVDFSLGIARREICPAVGCRFVVLDAKPDSIGFYAKQGFTLLNTAENKGRASPVMFVDLHKAAAT